MTLSIIGIVTLGCLFRWLLVSKGGAALAKLFLATPVTKLPSTRNTRQLCDVVDEMAVASSQRCPDLWVMTRESGINAFVAGNQSSGIVLVITKGALDSLTREELQTMVAHEFAHLRNGDLQLGMQ